MKKMYRIALFALLSAMAFAQADTQPAQNAPAGVESALLARVNEFYAMLVKQDYRKAESLIADDTKDYYYGGSKPDIKKFEVLSVEFSENFTHAKIMVRCTEPVVIAGFPPGEMSPIMPSLWKVENGTWVYYEDPNKIHNPSGLATKVQAAVEKANTGDLTPEAALKDLPKDPAFVLGRINLDKSQVTLTPGATATVTIANGADGPVSLELGAPLTDITAKLDRTDLSRGEKAKLTFTAGKEPKNGTFYLRLLPTGEPLTINVVVK
jgi:hypothetical protein